MSKLSETRIALRISRRSIKRNRLQSWLVVAVIALPLMAAGFVLTLNQSGKATPQELVKYQLGLAQTKYQILQGPSDYWAQSPDDASLSWFGDTAPSSDAPLEMSKVLPGKKLLKITMTSADFKTDSGVGNVAVYLGDTWNQAFLGNGPVDLVAGHLPTSDSEVLLSPSALIRFGVSVGETISTRAGESFTVAGEFRDYSQKPNVDVVYARSGALAEAAGTDTYYQLTGPGPTWNEVLALNKLGVGVLDRDIALNPPPKIQQPLATFSQGSGLLSYIFAVVLLLPMVLLPVIVLASSAFSFGARRQTRTLAVMSSLGASRSVLRRVTMASGFWLGILGGLLGLALGELLALVFVGPIRSNGWGVTPAWWDYPGFHVPWLPLVLAAGLSIGLGVVTSLVPAIRASKVNVLATLRGSRTEGQVRIKTGVGALVFLIAGVASVISAFFALTASSHTAEMTGTYDSSLSAALQLTGLLLGLGGAIVTIIAFMVGSGWILKGIRAVLSRMGVTANFAAKDLLFNRKRYAPVISSVLVVSFVSAFLLSFFYGPMKSNVDHMRYSYLRGQSAVELSWSPKNLNPDGSGLVSLEDFWAGEPTAEKVETTVNLLQSTGAFDSITPIRASMDFTRMVGVWNNDPDAESPVGEDFDVPTPVVVYNPESTCYATGLNPKSQDFWAQHPNGLTNANLEEPAGCISLDSPIHFIVIGGVKELRAISMKKDAHAEQVLADGGVVLFNRVYDYGGEAKIRWIKTSDSYVSNQIDAFSREVTLDSAVVGGIDSLSFAYGSMISEETARNLGIESYPHSVLVSYKGEISASTIDKLNANDAYLNLNNGTGITDPNLFAWIIFGFAAAFSLASTGISLGLSQIEARSDKRTLSAIGAPRSFRAAMVATQALTLTVTGSILGACTGILLGAAFLNGISPEIAQFPWVQLCALVFAVPALAGLAFWALTPRSLKYEVRQALD